MKTVKTTLVLPQKIWIDFQKITGKKKASQVISRVLSKMIQHFYAQKLLDHKADKAWDDAYLKQTLRSEILDVRKNLSFSK